VRRIFLAPTLIAVLFATPAASPFLSASPRQQPPSPAQAQPLPEPPRPIFTVVVDPAHGGADSGARSATGVIESEVVLDFARAIRVALEGQGMRALLTRDTNDDPTMDARSTMANGQRGAVFISLHVSSTGPVGTARAYWFAFPGDPQSPAASSPPSPGAPRGLIAWDQSQRPFLDSSKRLAELVQIQLAQKFKGSGETPEPAAVRQLRTIAAPAIAIEISSVSVPSAQQLVQMAGPLAEAVARGLQDFRAQSGGANVAPGGSR
jgi:N-acetylmuramoyl-L-alanine amidase